MRHPAFGVQRSLGTSSALLQAMSRRVAELHGLHVELDMGEVMFALFSEGEVSADTEGGGVAVPLRETFTVKLSGEVLVKLLFLWCEVLFSAYL